MIVFKSRNDLLIRTANGRDVAVQEDFDFTDGADEYRLPKQALSDGCSTPEALWSLGYPPFGEYWIPSLIHDAGYRNTLLKKVGEEWVAANLSKGECDLMFLACMITTGVPLKTRVGIYEGVSKFGWRAFNDDRQVGAQTQS